jgi:hypothetical protein
MNISKYILPDGLLFSTFQYHIPEEQKLVDEHNLSERRLNCTKEDKDESTSEYNFFPFVQPTVVQSERNILLCSTREVLKHFEKILS